MTTYQESIAKAFDHIDTIIKEIKKGERLHAQEAFHRQLDCGTAHCIAGWFVFDKAKEFGIKPEYKSHTDLLDEGYVDMANAHKVVEKYVDSISSDNGGCSFLREEFERNLGSYNIEWAFAKAALCLDNDEADSIFEASLTIEEIEDNLKRIKANYYMED